jgi:voltage-gated potassium channel
VLFVLIRLIQRARLRTWLLPAVLIGVVFATSWLLMALAEPSASPLVEPGNYWWWFLITTSTVGYGDFYPVTTLGHIVGGYVVLGGIATLSVIIARVAGLIESARGRRMRGAITVNASGHILILGYTPGRTERIIDELIADGHQVVLVTPEVVTTHPMPDRPVDFIRGDLTAEDVLRRAGAPAAASILVDADDDNQAIAVALTVAHVAPGCHTVITLRDLSRAAQVGYLSAPARAVHWHSPRIVTEELQSPGISRVYTELMTSGGQNTYALRLPDAAARVPFGDWQTALGATFQATIMAVDTGTDLLVSPPWDTLLSPGSVLYYVCRHRIPPDHLIRALPRHGRRGRFDAATRSHVTPTPEEQPGA